MMHILSFHTMNMNTDSGRTHLGLYTLSKIHCIYKDAAGFSVDVWTAIGSPPVEATEEIFKNSDCSSNGRTWLGICVICVSGVLLTSKSPLGLPRSNASLVSFRLCFRFINTKVPTKNPMARIVAKINQTKDSDIAVSSSTSDAAASVGSD